MAVSRSLNGMRVRVAFPLPQNRDAKGIVGMAKEVGHLDAPLFSIEPIGPFVDRELRERQFQEDELRLLL